MRVRLRIPLALLGVSLLLGCAAPGSKKVPPEEIAPEAAPAGFAAAIERTRTRLFGDPKAGPGETEARMTEDFLSGLVASAWRVAHAARYLDAPRFAAGQGVVGLPGLFNPDNRYQSALLDPDGAYRISGVRGSHALLSFQFLDAYPLIGLSKGLSVIDLDALGVEPGDPFVLRLGGAESEAGEEHWFPMPEGARAVLARQTFNDWESETPSRLRIDRLDATGAIPSGPAHETLAGEYLDRVTDLWADGYLARLSQLPVNVFPPIRASGDEAGGLAGQQGVIARYRVAEEEALVIRVRESDAVYQSIQLGNAWFVTQNPVRLTSSRNLTQARVDGDGMLRFVVSHRDPGVANWLATGGAKEGYVMIRWQGIATPLGSGDQPEALLVPWSELPGQLPSGTAALDGEQRTTELRERAHLPALKP